MTTTIVRATPEDLSEVVPLFDAYRRFYRQDADLDRASTFMAARLEQGDSVVLLARSQTKAVGFTQLYPSFTSVGMQRIWILNDLFVKESARHLGVGTALVEEAQRFARETQAARLTLATAIDNDPAQTLYESTGWVRDEAFIHYTYNL